MKWFFEPYQGKKHICPSCGKKTFVRIVDENGNPFGNDVGRCDREIKCGYFKKPDGKTEPIKKNMKEEKEKKVKIFDKYLFEKTLILKDNLSLFLINLFGEEAKEALNNYLVGTSKQFGGGATVFYQIDENVQMRTAKIMLYDKFTGKRVKEPTNLITWLHTIEPFKLKEDERIEQCLFGMHTVRYSKKPIAIVESEKTAIIMSIIDPSYTWLATGGIQNLKYSTIHPLKKLGINDIYLFADDGAEEVWIKKMNDLFFINYFLVNWKKTYGTYDDEGYDVADVALEHYFKEKIEKNDEDKLFREALGL